jgi:hypothetical protein
VIAIVARLPDPEVNLAALGGIVRAVTFAIESPLLALLTASAALSQDWDSYRRLGRFAAWGVGLLTLVHAAIAFTPLYDLVVTGLISAPPEIVEPGRYGLMLTVPFLAAVAYRRFNQGMLIRFGRSGSVAVGTVLRLALNTLVMMMGYALKSIPGALVAAAAMTAGVWIEAGYAALRARPVVRSELRETRLDGPPLTFKRFLAFYAPLATTNIAMFVLQPITSAALSRMPSALVSLAVFPAAFSVAFLLASGGTALVEVVVTLLDRLDAVPRLRHFTLLLAGGTFLLTLAMAATPLGEFWFGTVSGLSPTLFTPARRAMWLVLPYPVAIVVQGAYQGILTYARRTRAITEAVMLSSVVTLAVLAIGVVWGQVPGTYVGVAAFSLGALAQAFWLRRRGQPILETIDAPGGYVDRPASEAEVETRDVEGLRTCCSERSQAA